MLLISSKSLFNCIVFIRTKWHSDNDTPESSQQVTECLERPEPNYLPDCTQREAAGDLMTLFTRVTKLVNWQNHIMRKNMNADVRVYISPFSQCQCWLFSLAESVCVYSPCCAGPSLLRTFLSFIFFFWDLKQQKYKLRTKNRLKEMSQRQKCFSLI